jgi:hypothetical protein
MAGQEDAHEAMGDCKVQGNQGEGNCAFSGAAPDAEAMAKFSDQPYEQVYSRPTVREEEQVAMAQIIMQGNQDSDNVAFSGAARGHRQGKIALESNADLQSTVFDDDDPNSTGTRVHDHKNFEGSLSHPEDRQLKSIWEKAINSADRGDKRQGTKSLVGDSKAREPSQGKQEREGSAVAHSTELVEWKSDSVTTEEEGQESVREKRQRSLANSPWANEIKRVTTSNALAIVQIKTEPRQGIESPDRKRRAAPSPKRGGTNEEEDSSISSATVDELANAVLNQIQEAPKEANAPAGPREND